MAKFKVGDTVKILDGSGIPNYMGGWSENMNYIIGEKREIEIVCEKILDQRVGYYLEGCNYIFDERGLALCEETKSDPAEEIPPDPAWTIRGLDLDKLIRRAVDEKCEITLNIAPDNMELRVEPWRPFTYACPYEKEAARD